MISYERKCTCDRCGEVAQQSQNARMPYTSVMFTREGFDALFPKLKTSCCGDRLQQELTLCPRCTSLLVEWFQPGRLTAALDTLRDLDKRLEALKALRQRNRAQTGKAIDELLEQIRRAVMGW